MKIHSKTITTILIATAMTGLSGNMAFGHSFNVALVLPDTAQAKQIRQGFMLATTERDSHPDEESDGHLGGLDVYVRQVTTPENLDADIVVLLGTQQTNALFANQINQNNIAILKASTTQILDPANTGVARFISSYKKAYGSPPGAPAARGYNAARRIETAVRQQGAADNKNLLSSSFKQTATDFKW